MKLHQTLFILLVINSLLFVTTFSMNNSTIDTAIDNFESIGSNHFTTLTDFIDNAKSESNWNSKFLRSVASAFQNAINIVIMSTLIIGLFISSLFMFPYRLVNASTSPILTIAGFTGYLIVTWFNIRAVIQLWTTLKGSSS